VCRLSPTSSSSPPSFLPWSRALGTRLVRLSMPAIRSILLGWRAGQLGSTGCRVPLLGAPPPSGDPECCPSTASRGRWSAATSSLREGSSTDPSSPSHRFPHRLLDPPSRPSPLDPASPSRRLARHGRTPLDPVPRLDRRPRVDVPYGPRLLLHRPSGQSRALRIVSRRLVLAGLGRRAWVYSGEGRADPYYACRLRRSPGRATATRRSRPGSATRSSSSSTRSSRG